MRRLLATLVLAGPLVQAVAAVPAQRQAELLRLLEQDCGSCHGLTRKGGLGPPLLPSSLAGKSDDFLIATILNGRPGTAMPPWRGFFSMEEAAWLLQRLRAGR